MEKIYMKKKFIDIPEKNKVIAMMEEKHSVIDEISNASKKYAFVLNRIDFMFGRKDSTNPYFKSEAVAYLPDTFDVKTGHEIAGQKVDYKYHKSMIKQYNRYIGLLEDIIDTLERLRNEHIAKNRKITKNIRKF